jgi:hypothetical protein
MVFIKVLACIMAAFVAGTFVASPELRAFAAATIGSADIIDGSIQSVDIKNGQVKTADLGGSSVTSSKIASGGVANTDIASNAITSSKVSNGTLGYGDLSRSFITVEHTEDCDCGGTGWDPDGTSNTEIIYDDSITPNSAVVVTGIYEPTNYSCVIEDPDWGSVKFACAAAVPQGFEINYAVLNSQ